MQPDYLQNELFVLICQLQAGEHAREALQEDAKEAGFRCYAARLQGQIEASRAARLDLQSILLRCETKKGVGLLIVTPKERAKA